MNQASSNDALPARLGTDAQREELMAQVAKLYYDLEKTQNDIAKETRSRFVPGRRPWLTALSQTILAGRAHGLDVLDGVYNDIKDIEGFRRECEEGRDLGFDGKTLIHPVQLEPCNEVFSPSAEEVAAARRIVDAFALPENKGKGVISLDGRMVEIMHADIAARTVALADAIKSKA